MGGWERWEMVLGVVPAQDGEDPASVLGTFPLEEGEGSGRDISICWILEELITPNCGSVLLPSVREEAANVSTIRHVLDLSRRFARSQPPPIWRLIKLIKISAYQVRARVGHTKPRQALIVPLK